MNVRQSLSDKKGMVEMDISRREFMRNVGKYLRLKGLYRLSGREGEVEVEIRGLSDKKQLSDKKPKASKKLSDKLSLSDKVEEGLSDKKEETEVFPVRPENKSLTEYGCGCKRVEGKVYCPKHGRM